MKKTARPLQRENAIESTTKSEGGKRSGVGSEPNLQRLRRQSGVAVALRALRRARHCLYDPDHTLKIYL